jgi:mercuric ion binding protein
MKKLHKITLSATFIFAIASVWTDAAFAAVKTVTLSVPGMHCAVCPITVRKALEAVPGVSKVNVTYEPKEAVVTFDDAKTTIKALEDATFDAGYESKLKK